MMRSQDIFEENIRLDNDQIILRPSAIDDLDGLFALANTAIWLHSSTDIREKSDMQKYPNQAVVDRQNKKRQQFTIITKEGNQLIGCTSLENISEVDRRIEIGWTWLGLNYQGKGYNQMVKFLMLSYLFEQLDFARVEFRVRGSNIQSKKALAKIGATRGGTLRSYFASNGIWHDFDYFSILQTEWPAIKSSFFHDIK